MMEVQMETQSEWPGRRTKGTAKGRSGQGKEDQDKEKNTESKRIVLTFATNRVWTNYVTPCRLSLLSQRFNSLQNKHLHRDMKKKPRVTEVSITNQPIFFCSL